MGMYVVVSFHVKGSRNRIVSVSSPRMTTQDTFQGEPTPFPGPMFANRLQGIFRTGGDKTARGGGQRRDTGPIEPDRHRKQEHGYLTQAFPHDYPIGLDGD